MKSRKSSDPKVFHRIPARYLLLSILPLSACGGSEVDTTPDELPTNGEVPTNNVTLTGEVVKGPVANAIVFIDYNGDGQLNAGEPSQRTDSSGGFSFVDVDREGPIIALTDGTSVDTSSGLVIDGMRLTAPEGSSVISPLTTIMQEGGLTNAQVVAALGLPDVDLTSFNPFTADTAAETALAVEVAAQQVSVIVRSLSSAMQETGVSEADAADLAANAIAAAVSDTGSVDLTSNTIVTSAIENAVAELSSSQASAVSSIATEIAAAAANVNNIIATVSDLTSSETVDAFGLIADLTTQISEAVANGGDGSEITFTDIEAVNETPIEEAENSDPTGEVTITGTARQGETLTAVTSTLADADGLGSFSYQWKANGVVISGANSATLTLTQDEVGKAITVDVGYLDSGGTSEMVSSSATNSVQTSVDASGPTLVSFSVRDDTLSPGDTLYVDYEATDTSGIKIASFRFDDVNGNGHYATDADDDGVAELIVTDGMLSGIYQANNIQMFDESDLSNYSTYYEDGSLYGDLTDATHSFDLSTFGFTLDNPSSVDASGPTLVSFSVRDDTLSPGDTLYVDYEATDTSGIKIASFRFDDVNGNGHYATDADDDGVAELIVTDGMLSGIYQANNIQMFDESDLSNYSTYYEDGSLYGDLTDATHSFDLSTFGFTLDNPSSVDASGPTLVSFSVRDDTLSPGDTLYVDYEATDTSGIKIASFRFDDVNGNGHYATDADDDGVAELIVTDGMLSGIYQANNIQMFDESDLSNYSTYYEDGSLYGDLTDATHSFDLSTFGFTLENSIIL